MNIDQRRHVICNGSVCEGRFAYVCAYEVVLLVRRTRPATLFSWKCLNLLPNGAGPPSPQLEQVPGGAHDRRAFLLFEEPWRRGTGQTTTMSSSSFSSETQVRSQTRGAAAGARVARDRTSHGGRPCLGGEGGRLGGVLLCCANPPYRCVRRSNAVADVLLALESIQASARVVCCLGSRKTRSRPASCPP